MPVYHMFQVHSSGSEATFRRLVFLKCLSADGPLSLVWTNLRVLLFFNAFTYKLLNMIAIESPFVKEFRDFSETLKELHQSETLHNIKPSGQSKCAAHGRQHNYT